jgi:hypothetical protein
MEVKGKFAESVASSAWLIPKSFDIQDLLGEISQFIEHLAAEEHGCACFVRQTKALALA